MKQLRHNIRLVATMLIAIFVLLGAYFGYSVYFYGGRWFASPYNPRLNNQKQSVVAGDIYDRNGTTLATTVDGTRAYPTSEATRRAIAHVIGDSAGMVANGVEPLWPAICWGFQTSPLNRLTPNVQRRTAPGGRFDPDAGREPDPVRGGCVSQWIPGRGGGPELEDRRNPRHDVPAGL